MAEDQKKPLNKEVGVSGYKFASGYVYDEFTPELRGIQGRKKYREMIDTDPIIGAMLFAFTAIIRSAEWDFEPSPEDKSGEYAEWMKDTIFGMEEMTWDDVIEDALGMLAYGFAIQEIVTGRKKDGSIGLKKLAPRSQESIEYWDIERNGNVKGLTQDDPNGGFKVYLQKEKYVHFKTTYAKGNPEGRSILRNAYKPYHFIKNLQIHEAIGAERDLAGMPVITAPNAFLEDTANRRALEKIARDIKFNSQGGLVMASDTFLDGDGKRTNIKQYEIKLLSAEGSSGKVDTDKIINRHRSEMAASVLADFILLGKDRGSYALSRNKTDLFLKALEGVLENISQTIDKQVIPVLWRLNGFPPEMKPCTRPGRVAPIDLEELGNYVSKLSGSGIIFNDEPTENHLRDVAGLPPAPASDPLVDYDRNDLEDDGEGEENPSENQDDIEEGGE